MISLHALAKKMGVICVGKNIPLAGVTLDSRQVKAGYLYLAIKGSVADGHDYIGAAINNGAVAVVCENKNSLLASGLPGWSSALLKTEISRLASEVYQHPTEQLSVLGITGTNGKTSISYYLLQAIRALGDRCGQIGTLGLQLEDEVVITQNTTPDACTLQHFFSDALHSDTRFVAMEVSSHALDQGRVEGVNFSTAVFSNLTHDHLDYHISMDAYFEAKASLFKVQSLQAAVVNIDDKYGQALLRLLSGHEYKLLSYSMESEWADVYANNIRITAVGVSFDIRYKSKKYTIQTQLIGKFNISNLLAVVAVLLANNFKLEDIIQCLSSIKPVRGRMEIVENTQSILALVDYAHTPDALKNVLHAAQEYMFLQKEINPDAKLITVFGCGGDRDLTKRAVMGKVVETLSDITIVTADNPRSESQAVIAANIIEGFSTDQYVQIDDRKAAIQYAVDHANSGDVIVVAGKGHEDYQLIGDEVLFFSDAECLSSLLRSKAQAPGGRHV